MITFDRCLKEFHLLWIDNIINSISQGFFLVQRTLKFEDLNSFITFIQNKEVIERENEWQVDVNTFRQDNDQRLFSELNYSTT